MTFIIHAGGEIVPLDQVEAVVTPEATPTWTPVPHIAFFNAVLDSCSRFNFTVVDAQHCLMGDMGEDYFGYITLGNTQTKDWNPIYALRNSNRKRFSIEVSTGNRVTMCDNLLITGEIRERRKHSKHILKELGYMIYMTVQELYGKTITQGHRIDTYQKTLINIKEQNNLVVQAMKHGIISSQQIKKVVDQFMSDEHREQFGEEPTCWSYINVFTEILKGQIIGDPKRSIRLTDLFDGYTGYKEAA